MDSVQVQWEPPVARLALVATNTHTRRTRGKPHTHTPPLDPESTFRFTPLMDANSTRSATAAHLPRDAAALFSSRPAPFVQYKLQGRSGPPYVPSTTEYDPEQPVYRPQGYEEVVSRRMTSGGRDDGYGPLTHAFILRREITSRGGIRWYEFLLVHTPQGWAFPRGEDPEDVEAALAASGAAGVLLPDRTRRPMVDPDHRDITCASEPKTRFHLVAVALDQCWAAPVWTPPSDVHVGGQLPKTLWALESEMSSHETMGLPMPLEAPLTHGCLEAWQKLPVRRRFASENPPIVLYFPVPSLAKLRQDVEAMGGRLPTLPASSPQGPGVYLHRLGVAARRADPGASHRSRDRPCVLRCAVFAPRIVMLMPSMVCTCGCKQMATDHGGVHAHGSDGSMLSEMQTHGNASWCIRNPDAVVVLQTLAVPTASRTGKPSKRWNGGHDRRRLRPSLEPPVEKRPRATDTLPEYPRVDHVPPAGSLLCATMFPWLLPEWQARMHGETGRRDKVDAASHL